jgi:tRNA(fMet)-specific endonuclease VapC
LFRVLPFSREAAVRSAAARLALEAAGMPIGRLDFMAAGHALAVRYTFVTDNTREFERVAGLRLENWLR